MQVGDYCHNLYEAVQLTVPQMRSVNTLQKIVTSPILCKISEPGITTSLAQIDINVLPPAVFIATKNHFVILNNFESCMCR